MLGIGQQMLHRQLRLNRVDAAIPQLVGKLHMQLDALQRTRHKIRATEQTVQVDHPGCRAVACAKTPATAGSGFALFPPPPWHGWHCDDALRIAAGALGALLDQVEIAHHHLQQVIEVMGDATGQLPQRFQILCATHALFSVMAPAHVQLRGEKYTSCPRSLNNGEMNSSFQKVEPSLR